MSINTSTPSRHLLFLHIQKTAGSTLHNIIGRQYKPSETMNLYNMVRDADKVKKLPPAEREKLRLVKGHFLFGVHEQFSEPCEYITILRDPVERTISHFYHAAEDPGNWYHKEITSNGYTLKDALEKGFLPNLENNMVRMLSGNNRIPFGTCTEEMLQTARKNLAEHFSIVGIQNRFDEFVLQSAARFHWNRFLYYRKKRVGKTRPKQQQLDPEVLEAVKACNQLDQRLFDEWSVIVQQRIEAEGPEFARKVQQFKKRNRQINQFLGWWPAALTP